MATLVCSAGARNTLGPKEKKEQDLLPKIVAYGCQTPSAQRRSDQNSGHLSADRWRTHSARTKISVYSAGVIRTQQSITENSAGVIRTQQKMSVYNAGVIRTQQTILVSGTVVIIIQQTISLYSAV